MIKKILSRLAIAIATLSLALGVALPKVVGATEQEEQTGRKVTICHRNNDVKKPYVEIEVDESSVNGVGKHDHFGEHKGPLASSEAVAQALKDSHTRWGDIIPPVEGVHDGLNWTAEGQAMHANDCKFVTPDEPEDEDEGEVLGQVTNKPTGSVNAGVGGASTNSVATIGLLSSIGTVGLGLIVRKLAKQ